MTVKEEKQEGREREGERGHYEGMHRINVDDVLEKIVLMETSLYINENRPVIYWQLQQNHIWNGQAQELHLRSNVSRYQADFASGWGRLGGKVMPEEGWEKDSLLKGTTYEKK